MSQDQGQGGVYNKPYARPAALRDVCDLIPKIRQADKDEVGALGLTLEQGLGLSYINSTLAWSIIYKNKVVGMFGVNPSELPDVGCPWMLSSDELYKIGKSFIKKTPFFINLMYQQYETLTNVIDCRNHKSISWLGRCGFKLTGDLYHLGPDKVPFTRFIGTNKESNGI